MTKSIMSEILPGDVDGWELLSLLKNRYGSAGNVSERSLVFPSQPDYTLRVTWKEGRVSSIQAGKTFSAQEMQSVRSLIQACLIESPTSVVARGILFCSTSPVLRHLRTANIQFLPPLPSAPRPNVIMADHPFVIEWVMPRSCDDSITRNRRLRTYAESTWVLNAMLRSGIRCEGLRSKHAWVMCEHDAAPLVTHAHWSQEGFIYPEFGNAFQEDFTPADGPLISQMSHEEYYGSRFRPGGERDEFVLPDSLGALLAAVDSLAHQERRRLIRAARWMYAAPYLWVPHASSYYIALIAAIEALASGEPIEHCPKCDQVERVTERFREFVERFVPVSGSEEHEVSKKRLYQLRSKLAHGKQLFVLDELPWLFQAPGGLEEREALDELSRVVKRVFVGWLLQKGKTVQKRIALAESAGSESEEV